MMPVQAPGSSAEKSKKDKIRLDIYLLNLYNFDRIEINEV